MAGQVDREGVGRPRRRRTGEQRRVPRVGVQSRAVQQGDPRASVAPPERTQRAPVLEAETDSLDVGEGGDREAGIRRLGGEEGELVVGTHGAHSAAVRVIG